MRALKGTLGLRIASLEDHPTDRQLPAERGERLGHPATRTDRGLAVPHQLLRQRSELLQIPGQTPQDVRRLLAEDQRAGDRARPTHLTSHHPTTSPLAVPDRNALGGLPQIALDQLPRPIDRPLERPRPQEPRADLPHKIIKDRLPTLIADLDGHLPQPLRLQPRLDRELLTDPVLERIELRPARRPRIPRRLRRRQSPPDRLSMQPRPPADLPNRQPVNPVQPPDLRPLLHPDHTPSSLARTR